MSSHGQLSHMAGRRPTSAKKRRERPMLRIFGLLTQTSASNREQLTSLSLRDSARDSGPVPAASPIEPAGSNPAPLHRHGNRHRGPRLFVQSNYVAAVRVSDGAVLSHGVAAMPADVIELYGTGFGPASIDACSQVTVTIGGVPADVGFAGRVGPALFQIDVTVPPGLASGDHAVVASLAGIRTEGAALLKIAKAPEPSSPNPEGRYSCFMRRAIEGVSC